MMDNRNDPRHAFEVLPWTPLGSQGEFGRGDVTGAGFKVGSGNPIPRLWRSWGRTGAAGGVRESELGETEGEAKVSPFGPVHVELEWHPRSVSWAGMADHPYGGVYVLVKKSGSIWKVGKTASFQARVMHSSYVTLKQNAAVGGPDMRFWIAKVIVRGRRVNAGGIVEMVEFALARLLRRAGLLRGSKLPYAPRSTAGPVRIRNVLPPAILARLGATPVRFAKAGGDVLTQRAVDLLRSGELRLGEGFAWETELPAAA